MSKTILKRTSSIRRNKSKSKSKKVTKTLKNISHRTRKMGGTRTRSKPLIETVELGNIPTSYTSNIKMVSQEELINFVNSNIHFGPQIVSLPVPPYRHAFLVDIQYDKIMICDWNGEETRTFGMEYINNKKNKKYIHDWKQYSDFMTLLEEKYEKEIEYYPIDEEIHKKSKEHNIQCNGGGCSNYVYAWVDKHYYNR
jgi:hypothetical protein